MSEPRTPFLRRWSVGIAYVVLCVALSLVGGIGFVSGDSFGLATLGTGMVALGPIGILSMLFLALPMSLVVASSTGTSEIPAVVIVAILAAIVGVVNVIIARRWARLAAERTAAGVPGARRVAVDRGVGAILFGFAGAGFVLLSIIAGVEVSTANGIDAGPLPHANTMVLVATICWWTGLASAVAGLVLWIVLRVRGRSILAWAIVDAVIVIAANVVCFAVDSALNP